MARAMFNYTVEVLKKVSFDLQLFTKELTKALSRLLPHEIQELKIWFYNLIQERPMLASCQHYFELHSKN